MVQSPIKVILIGAAGCGKTYIFQYLTEQTSRKQTVTCTYSVGSIDSRIPIQLWDTPGAEKFRAVLTSALRASSIVLIVFDIKKYRNVDLEYWVDLAYTYNATIPGIVVIINNCTAQTPAPACPYKTIQINTLTNYNMDVLKAYIVSICDFVAPYSPNTLLYDQPTICKCCVT